LKLLPQIGTTGTQSSAADFDEDNDHSFAGMILCTQAGKPGWILDSGAIDHMTYISDHLLEIKQLTEHSNITLPNGHFSEISYIGKVKLSSTLVLNEVLYVPLFKYNLLSVPKLTKDTNYIVTFYPTLCIIQDLDTKKILGIGKRSRGLYFLQDNPLHGVDNKMQDIIIQLIEIYHSKNIMAVRQ